MKDIILKINESQSKSITIDLDNDSQLYDLLNALYTEYVRLNHEGGDAKYYKKGIEKLYDNIRLAAKKAKFDIDPDYDKSVSKLHFE